MYLFLFWSKLARAFIFASNDLELFGDQTGEASACTYHFCFCCFGFVEYNSITEDLAELSVCPNAGWPLNWCLITWLMSVLSYWWLLSSSPQPLLLLPGNAIGHFRLNLLSPLWGLETSLYTKTFVDFVVPTCWFLCKSNSIWYEMCLHKDLYCNIHVGKRQRENVLIISVSKSN